MSTYDNYNLLKEALHASPHYAHAWHCNVAMSCYDAIREESELFPHTRAMKIGNEAASRFMKLAFDVVTGPEPAQDTSETADAVQEGPGRRGKL